MNQVRRDDDLHALHPPGRIGGFQLFGNALGISKFGDQGVIQFGRRAVNFCKVFVQFAGCQQGGVGPFSMFFEIGEVLPTEPTDFLLVWQDPFPVEGANFFGVVNLVLRFVFHGFSPLCILIFDLTATK